MKFTIYGTLDGLNTYTKQSRANKYSSNKMKQDNQKRVIQAIRDAKLSTVTKYPFRIKTTWYEPDMRRDGDNVAFGKKFLLDSLVQAGIIENDSRKFVNEYYDIVLVDRKNPRIEVELIENRQIIESDKATK